MAPTVAYLQLADQSTCYIEGITIDLLVQIRDSYIPADFMILDMGNSKDVPLILGRPFLNTVNACIFVGSRNIQMTLARKRETFPFAHGPLYATDLQEKRPDEKEARNSKKLGTDKKRENPRSRRRG